MGQRTGSTFPSTTSAKVFLPTSFPIFQAEKTCPSAKISSVSSKVLSHQIGQCRSEGYG